MISDMTAINAQYAVEIQRMTSSSCSKLVTPVRSIVTRIDKAPTAFARASRGGTNHGEDNSVRNQSATRTQEPHAFEPARGQPIARRVHEDGIRDQDIHDQHFDARAKRRITGLSRHEFALSHASGPGPAPAAIFVAPCRKCVQCANAGLKERLPLAR